jgi:hypothetical protein
MAHATTTDDIYDGYFIPKGSLYDSGLHSLICCSIRYGGDGQSMVRYDAAHLNA